MDMERFFNGLSKLFAEGRTSEVRGYLLRGLDEAETGNDEGAVVGILNEMIGYYRSVSEYAEAIRVAERALSLMRRLGYEGTVHYGTTLLNAATAHKAAGDANSALGLFSEALAIYTAELPEGDPRLAGLYNNISAVYRDAGAFEKARENLEKAAAILSRVKGAEGECATVFANLGLVYSALNREQEAMAALGKARELFGPDEEERRKNPHYAAALAALAGARFAMKQYPEAASLYEETLGLLKAAYGENKDYAVTCRNAAAAYAAMDDNARAAVYREKAESLLSPRAPSGPAMSGLELARAYYDAHGKQMVRAALPEAWERVAAGLVGEGSECFGFDDEISRDHDFGPSFCLWLGDDDYAAFGAVLQQAYDALPGAFMGYPARRESGQGGGRVGVLRISDFYRKHTGRPDGAFSLREWLRVPEAGLAAATNGAVFTDPQGEFSQVREALSAHYPRDVRLKKMAARAALMAQSGQYNYARCMSRGETVAAFWALAEFARHAAAMVFLLNRKYMPFYKWAHRAMLGLPVLNEVAYLLDTLSLEGLAVEKWRFAPPRDMVRVRNADDANVAVIERICDLVGDALRDEGLTDSHDDFLLAHAERITGKIADAGMRSLPLTAGVEG